MLGKPAASLSSGLLARKGHARPAMRPQGYMQVPNGQEDLGWNDMGEEEPYPQPYPAPEQVTDPVPAPPVLRQRAELEEQIAQPPAYQPLYDDEEEDEEFDETAELDDAYAPLTPMAVASPVPVASPAPMVQSAPLVQPVPVVRPAPAPVSAGMLARVAREVHAGKAKAAFTLRLDTERHLRLRLASAVHNRSAQQLVTEALDAFLESMTEVDVLASQLSGHETRRSGE